MVGTARDAGVVKLISADGAKIELRLVGYQFGQPDGTAWPSSAANKVTTGHARTGGVKHQMKRQWQPSAGVGQC